MDINKLKQEIGHNNAKARMGLLKMLKMQGIKSYLLEEVEESLRLNNEQIQRILDKSKE